MRVQQIMTQTVEAVSPDTSVLSVAQAMRERQIGFLPVVENGAVVGTITDRDIAVRLVPDLPGTAAVPARSVMSCPVHVCYADQEVEEVAAMMGDNQVRRLPVLDRAGRLVGLLSLGDIAEHASERLAGEALGEIVEKR